MLLPALAPDYDDEDLEERAYEAAGKVICSCRMAGRAGSGVPEDSDDAALCYSSESAALPSLVAEARALHGVRRSGNTKQKRIVLDFWCADATSPRPAGRFSFALVTPLYARSGLCTGNSAHASLLLCCGSLALIFTAPYSNAYGAAAATTVSVPFEALFACAAARRFVAGHGLVEPAVALRIADTEDASRPRWLRPCGTAATRRGTLRRNGCSSSARRAGPKRMGQAPVGGLDG